MKILAFDTSTFACSVALSDGQNISEHFEIVPQRHAELILPMIEGILQQNRMKLLNLDAIAFGAGPGSFMGVRIATSVAQSLGYAAQIPLVSISSLQALAQTAYQVHHCPSVIAAWDARMQAIYWGAYRVENEIMQPIMIDSLASPSQIIITKESSFSWDAVGNGWDVYRDQLAKPLQLINKVYGDLYPRAAAIIKIAELAYQQGKTVSALEAQPIYLRNEVAKVSK